MRSRLGLTETWGQVYVDGKLMPAHEAAVCVFDRGFLYGDGVYETLRVYGGKPFMLDAHLRRMAEGCAVISLKPPDRDAIEQGVHSVLDADHLQEAYLRITVTRGATGRLWYDVEDALPTVVIIAKPYTPPDFREGVRLIVSRFPTDELSPLSGVKQIGILAKILARREASGAGADDAILLDHRGNVSEATSSNVFWVSRGKLFTPSLSCGILAGITRAIVMELARADGLEVCEGEFGLDSLLSADEAFLTSSTWEIAPIASVNDVEIGGTERRVAERLHSLYLKKIEKELQLQR